MNDGPICDTSVGHQRERFRAWLSTRPGAGRPSIVETHVSMLGLGTDRVWKLKKAVRFPFVDLSTAELRRRNAEREAILNRRFSPDVYLGVTPLDDFGPTAEVVVEMQRMPAERRLSALTQMPGGQACIDGIARSLARVHAEAPTGGRIDQAGSPAALLSRWNTNLGEMRQFAPAILDESEIDRVATAVRAYVTGRTPLLERRVSNARIRDGHGDLLADDVYCLDDGPRFLDCLEFDDELRFGDVLCDVGFLAMDLERVGRRDLADRLLEGYREHSGDSWPVSLADFYIAYRAMIRSKIACLRATAPETEADSGAQEARRVGRALFELGARHLDHGCVRLVLVGGAPATGKTTLARALADGTGWTALHSDEVRKGLAAIAPTVSAAADLDAGLYSPSWNDRVYAEMFSQARVLLEHGECVIIDASWSEPARRAEARALASSTWSELGEFVLHVPTAVAEARAQTRAELHADASDVAGSLTSRLHARFAPWPEARELDAEEPVGTLANVVRDALTRPEVRHT